MFRWLKNLLGQVERAATRSRPAYADAMPLTYCGHCDSDPCHCDDEQSVLDIILDTRTGEFAADFAAMIRMVKARHAESVTDSDGDPFAQSFVLEQTAADDPNNPGQTSV